MKTLCISVFVLLSVIALWAQSTAQIQGTVKDSTGLAVPGAAVKAIQTDTGASRTVISGTDGVYVLANLPIGPYRLEVSRQGFTTFVQTGIVLQVGTTPTIDVALKVGAVTEQVQVEANAALVESQNTSIGQVIDNQQILELPLNGRQATDLIQLAGAAIPAGVEGTGGMPGGVFLSVAGGQPFGVAYFLDGTEYQTANNGVNYPFPFPDALQEFKVEASAQTAVNGIHSGGSVNAVTKSGTNSFHGDLFEFVRNGDFNARNFFATQNDSLKRNQYGGTIGGPVRKNKLFFFAGYQGTKTRQDPSASTAFVPTAQMLAGDWTDFASAACNGGKAINLPAPFAGNRISPALYDRAGLAIAAKLPSSNDPCGKTIFGNRTVTDEYQLLGRMDFQLSEKQTFFWRYMTTTYKLAPSYSLTKNLLSSNVGGLDDRAQAYIIGDTYLLSPTIVNSARLAVNRTGIHRFNDDFFSGCDLGVQMFCFLPHQSVFNVTGGFALSGGTVGENSPTNTTYQLSDDISLVRGAHQINFGGATWYWMGNNRANVFSQGTFTFNGQATGLGMADMFLGQLDTFTQGVPNTLFSRKWYMGLYAADTWKVSPRFTVNLGLRWEPSLQTGIADGDIYDFDYSKFLQGVKSTVYVNAPAGLTWPGDPGFPRMSGINRRWNNFGPRVGVAWDPKGNGRMSIRAAYGIAFDTNGGSPVNAAVAPPFGNTLSVSGPVPLETPWITTPGGNPFPRARDRNATFTPNGTYIAYQPDMKTTNVHTWNVSIQRQIGQAWLVSASYLGSETEHLWVTKQLNPGQFLGLGSCTLPLSGARVWTPCSQTGNLPQRRLFSIERPAEGSLVGFMDQFDAGGTANYNGLILTLQRRLSKGVAVSTNYTWSHCIGDLTQGAGVNGGGAGYQDLNNRRFDRGNCGSQQIAGNFSTDKRQIFNLTMVAETPRFADRIVRAAATGWKFSPIFRASTGGWLTVASGLDRTLNGNNNQRADQVLPSPLCAHPGPSCWINPAAFAQPALGTLGNLGKFNIPSPGFWQLDAALSRVFRIRERQSVELRSEAFNLTNSFHAGISSGVNTSLTGITTTLNSSTFGQMLSAVDPRIMQFALKFVF